MSFFAMDIGYVDVWKMGMLRILRSRSQEGTYLLFMDPDAPLSMTMMRHLLIGQPACCIKRENGANAAQRGNCGEKEGRPVMHHTCPDIGS